VPERARAVAGRLRPSPAAIVGGLAIIVAMTGSALAVKKGSVRSSHIQDGAVRSKELRQLGITKVADGSLLVGDIAAFLPAHSDHVDRPRPGSRG